MRQFVFVCAVFFCFLLPAAAAEDSAPVPDASTASTEAAPQFPLPPSERDPWQQGAGFVFSHYNVLGTSFHDLGFRSDISRYLNRWFAVEGAAMAGFGHTGGTPNLDAKTVFLGGGPHFSIVNTPRFEPWFHVLGGWEHFRFSQTATLGAESHVAFLAGGGLDYKIRGSRIYWRVQADFIGVKIGSSVPADYAVGTGLVLNF